MANYTWPAALPQAPVRDGYSESHGLRVLSTPMDKGPAKVRRLGRRAVPVSVQYWMSAAQVVALDAFIDTSLRGIRRFNWPHPRLQQSVEARLVAGDSGEFYTLSYATPTEFLITLRLELLP